MSDPLAAARQGFDRLDFPADVRDRAHAALTAWFEDPEQAGDRAQLEALIAAGRFDDLFDAFWQVIPFGTGGRRGPVGLGTNRFNATTLLGSVQGHAEILAETYPGEPLTVVVAFDVRAYHDRRGVYDPDLPLSLRGLRSADFARRAAGVYAANGIAVLMLDPDGDTFMATPELSYAIRRHGAHGGLNVSASHNHPDDNGGKFYNRHGGQDVPPNDEILAERVATITRIREEPFEQAVAAGRVTFLGPDENAAYLDMNRALSVAPDCRGGRLVYTPLHGTGSVTVGRLLRQEGFEVVPVPEQEGFDGGFPTVKFLAPNPEVPSCYERAEVVADEVGADLILSTDPDADRIGIEVRGPDGAWRFVTGDETLLLATHFILSRRRAAGSLPPDPFVIKTLVTSERVATIARAHGCHVVGDLLVGFKYMADVLQHLEEDGAWRELRCPPESFVMGVEESHGLLLTHEVRDKDAAGPALVLAEYNAWAAAQGRTLHDELLSIYGRYGAMANRLFTTVMAGATGLARIRAIQDSLRQDPPTSLDGLAVTRCDDLADPSWWMGPLKSGTDAAGRNVLALTLEDGSRVLVRPSGTEPKTKVYVEVPGATADDPTAVQAELARCEARAEQLGKAFERLMLERIGLTLDPHAEQLSGLLGIEHKLDFGQRLLPALRERAAAGADGLDAWLDEALAPYGADADDLVAGGLRSLAASGDLPADVAAALRQRFGG